MKLRTMVEECPGVYPPREDSYLLLESVDVNPGERFLDAGTGTGIIGINAALNGARVVAIDISPKAVRCARRNAEKAEAELRVIEKNISECKDTFDVMAFNPPYLPVSGKEYEMKAALESEKGGSEAAEAFVAAASKTLSPGGRAYLLLSSFTDRTFMDRWGSTMVFEEVSRNHIFFEDIFVFMVKRRKDL